jgi:hypothetical protein
VESAKPPINIEAGMLDLDARNLHIWMKESQVDSHQKLRATLPAARATILGE